MKRGSFSQCWGYFAPYKQRVLIYQPGCDDAAAAASSQSCCSPGPRSPQTQHGRSLRALPPTHRLMGAAAFPPADTATTERHRDTRWDGSRGWKSCRMTRACAQPHAAGTAPAPLTWCRTCTPPWGTLPGEAASGDRFWAGRVPWVGRRKGTSLADGLLRAVSRAGSCSAVASTTALTTTPSSATGLGPC